jgi:hypothetical protein
LSSAGKINNVGNSLSKKARKDHICSHIENAKNPNPKKTPIITGDTSMGQIIIISFYAVFLVIFFITALVALGGILRIGPCKNIDPIYTKWLVIALLIELTGAVLLTYNSLPKPDWQTTQPYHLSMTYVDYVHDWKKSLTSYEIDCIEFHKEGYLPSVCSETIDSYKKIKSIAGDEGAGELYLEQMAGPNRHGQALYLFPGENIKIVMDVTGRREIQGSIHLTFRQPMRYILGSEGKLIKRPEYKFTIEFVPDKKDNKIYRGTLYHPSIKVDGKRMKLADAILVKKSV